MLNPIRQKIFIPYIYPADQNKKSQIYFCGNIQQDTVNIQHCNDLLTLKDEDIITAVKSSLNDNESLIGTGGDARVYKIKDTDYCVRIPIDNFSKLQIAEIIDKDLVLIDKIVSEVDKINHIKAHMNNGITIMDYISGEPVFTPSMYMNESEQVKMSKMIEEIPVSGYSKLLKQICKAYEYDMYFDCSGSNVIFNPKNKSLTAIDFYKAEYTESLHPLTHIYAALNNDKTTIEQKKISAGKIFNAVINELYPEQKSCTHISNFDFYRFIYNLKNSGIIENKKYADRLCDIFSQIEELKYAQIRGVEVTKELNGKLKALKCLVTRIFGKI